MGKPIPLGIGKAGKVVKEGSGKKAVPKPPVAQRNLRGDSVLFGMGVRVPSAPELHPSQSTNQLPVL